MFGRVWHANVMICPLLPISVTSERKEKGYLTSDAKFLTPAAGSQNSQEISRLGKHGEKEDE